MNACFKAITTVSVVVFLVGCSSSNHSINHNVISDELHGAPEWVLEGRDNNDKTISAIGSVTGTNNVSLARSTALARARTELSRQLSLSIKAMLKDYQATVTGGGAFGKAADDEQYIEEVSKQMTELNLSGSRQEDTWISGTGAYYVMVSLDIGSFKDTVHRMSDLSEEIRRAVANRAEKAFADLDSH